MSPILRLFGAVAILAMALLGLSARSARADFVYADFDTVNSTSGGQTLQVNGSAFGRVPAQPVAVDASDSKSGWQRSSRRMQSP